MEQCLRLTHAIQTAYTLNPSGLVIDRDSNAVISVTNNGVFVNTYFQAFINFLLTPKSNMNHTLLCNLIIIYYLYTSSVNAISLIRHNTLQWLIAPFFRSTQPKYGLRIILSSTEI